MTRGDSLKAERRQSENALCERWPLEGADEGVSDGLVGAGTDIAVELDALVTEEMNFSRPKISALENFAEIAGESGFRLTFYDGNGLTIVDKGDEAASPSPESGSGVEPRSLPPGGSRSLHFRDGVRQPL